MLKDNILTLRQGKPILLMPHLVLGYPSFEENLKLIREMVAAGAEIIEMQIPFSEPMADGPVIMRANDRALKNGTNTTACFAFCEKVCAEFPDTQFLFMTYYNILFAYGVERFVAHAKAARIQGLIVPDLPPEEGADYLAACAKESVSPIFIFAPTHKDERLKTIARYSQGMVYGVGRKGVTGIKTAFDAGLHDLIKRYKGATDLPLALGFGIQEKEDVAALIGTVDIAVIGTRLLTIQEQDGTEAVGRFLRELRT